MAIVAHEIESIHGDPQGQRMIFYRFQDSEGEWHRFGPVIMTDPDFDTEAHRARIAGDLESSLAEREADQMLESKG
jgi:hypothetical protein